MLKRLCVVLLALCAASPALAASNTVENYAPAGTSGLRVTIDPNNANGFVGNQIICDQSGTSSATDSTKCAIVSNGRLAVDGSGVTQPVSGTFWQATQPVSGTFWQATQPVSGSITCSNCSGAGVSAVDEVAFTAGTSLLAPDGGFFQTTATNNALTNGQQGMWQMTANRAGFVNLRTAAGVEIGTSGSPIRNDPTGTTTQPVSGTFWQSTQPVSGTFWQTTQPVSGSISCSNCSGAGVSAIDEAAFTGGTSLLAPTGGFFQTTATNNPLTTGQQGMWQMTANRAGFVNLRTAAGVELGTSGAPVRIDPVGTTTQPVSGTFWQTTQPVSAAALPLPTGAATSANQPTSSTQGATTSGQTGHLMMGAATTGFPTATTGDTWPLSINPATGGLRVDGSGVTQPVSAASLPLPTGAATSANQTNATQKTQIVDGSGNVIQAVSNNLGVQCANCSGTGASAADLATFTSGTSVFAPSGIFFQTTATSNQLTTGKQGMWQGTAQRAGFVNLRDSSGNEEGLAGQPLKTDGSGVTQPVSGTFWQATQPVSGNIGAMANVGNSSTQLHVCGSQKFVHITTATDTQILAASGATNIYICDYQFSFGGAGNFYFEKSSTGTCGTPTQIGMQWYGTANLGKTQGTSFYTGFNTGASQQLCANTSTFTGPLDLTVFYDQY